MVQALKKTWKWISERIKDLLYDPTNKHLDNGRMVGHACIVLFGAAVIHNLRLKEAIDLQAMGTGLSLLVGALVIYILKDRQQNGS